MKCSIPEISWHNREPVLSVDIHPVSEKFYRLASGGADCHVLIWQLNVCDNGALKIEALSDLTRHQRAVNSVKWSPDGQYLATADDDANIILWQLKTDNIPLLEGESNDKEVWIVLKVIRGHKDDIYDLCWSPNSQKLLSGSVDNTAILWDFVKGKNDNILTDHKGFVQGVTWDPKNQFIATISTDRVCRIYETSGKQVKVRMQRGYLPVPTDHYLFNKEVKFFHDDTFKSFFRRLDFSPDGTLLAVPSGRVEVEDCKKILHATYLFAVDLWGGPIAMFPSGRQCSTVVRFCPILFELHDDGTDAVISLPYRMIIAIGTDHDVILYDTQQLAPFAYFKDIHYTRLTDLAWSKDGQLLFASSTDGFCSLITFEVNELGVPYVKEEESETEDISMNISGCEELVDKEDSLDISKEKSDVTKPKKLNLLEQWTIKTPKKSASRGGAKLVNNTDNQQLTLNNVEDNMNKKLENNNKHAPEVHKRINPISVQSNKVYDISQSKLIISDKKEQVSPLLNFLQGSVKNKNIEKRKSEVTTLQPNLVLDETEARDAFPSEKVGDKCSVGSKRIENVDEYTEEFSLHLEDTNTAENSEQVEKDTKVPSEDMLLVDDANKIEQKNCEDIGNSNHVDDKIKLINANLFKETNEAEMKNKLKLIEQNHDCKNAVSVELKRENNVSVVSNVTEDCVELRKQLDKSHLGNSTENKTVTKRRIPLITLSSPKHKKK